MCTQVGGVYGRGPQVGDVYRLPRTFSKGHRPAVTVMVPSFPGDIHETEVTEVSETE